MGRDADDNIEVSGPAGWTNASGCSGSPNFQGSWMPNADPLNVPPTKNYVYDDRLRYRSPPFFLDPVQAAWKVNRSNEQVPAAG